jgi:hypothetical protein
MRVTFVQAVACFALCAVARGASAQDARLRGALDAETFGRVTRIIDSARAESLPVDPLVGVALEGAQRRAPGARIASAVHDYLAALRGARLALGAEAPAAEIVSGAGVLLSGVSTGALRDLRTVGQRRSLTVALVVLADLVARGVPADTAGRAITAAVRANARDEDFTALRRFVEQDIVAGASPAAAAMLRVRNISGVTTEFATPLPGRRP